MDREQPIPAPEPRRGLLITHGYCPEFWRWRVVSSSPKGITLRDSKGTFRIEPDQWLLWLAGRCQHGTIYVDGQRLARPAAVRLMLPGDVPEPAVPFEPRPPPVSRDPATLLRRAREVQKYFRIYRDKDQTRGPLWCLDGQQRGYRVTYDLEKGSLPACNCGEEPRFDTVCRHGLAVLLMDPAAKVLLLRALT